jgi:hypothetical protein
MISKFIDSINLLLDFKRRDAEKRQREKNLIEQNQSRR